MCYNVNYIKKRGVTMANKSDLNKLIQISKDIHSEGGDVYFVGGYVRDNILGLDNKDIDVEIHNISVDKVKNILSKYGSVDIVGASFGVLMLRGLDIDFAFPRTESRTGSKHTDFEITVNPYLGLEDASKRRDFTMNSIMQNVLTGEYIDLHGGISDIKNKVIKYVDKETFVEDALRPLRACQFASRLGFKVDPSVINLAKTMDYKNLSKERIVVELDKGLLKSDKPSIALNYLLEMGILNQIIPELVDLKGCEQNKEFHPEGDVWNHTMLVIDKGAQLKHKTNNPRFFMYACLLHDIGKPSTTEFDEKGILRSKNHDKVGADIAVSILNRLTTEKEIAKYVYSLTKYHMVAHKLLELKDYKIKKIMLDCDINDLLILNTCDISGRESSESSIQRLSKVKSKFEKINELSEGGFGVIEPYIQGRNLIELGMKPSKEFGELIKASFELQLQGKSKSDILEILNNRINPKPKLETIVIEDIYLASVNRKEITVNKSDKREKLFKRFTVEAKNSQSPIKLNKTNNKNIPYLLVIMKNEDSVNKVFFFPDMCILTDTRLTKHKIVFDNYMFTLSERMGLLRKIIMSTNLKDNQRDFLMKIYSNLR